MTLAEYLLARLQAAGLTVNDISLVEWNDATWGWKPVDRAAFIALAQSLNVSDITVPNRERLRFQIVTDAGIERVFQWDGAQNDFVVIPEEPKIVTLIASDLTV